MKTITFLSLLFVLSLSVSAQTDTTIDGKKAMVTSTGMIITEGMDIKTGRGTLNNGDYKYIHTSSRSWTVIAAGTNSIVPLNRKFNGLKVRVKTIKKIGNKKRGYKYLLFVGAGDITNYEVEIEDALATGEVVNE